MINLIFPCNLYARMMLMSMIGKQGGIKKTGNTLVVRHYDFFLIQPMSDHNGGEKSFHYYQQ
jgi:hypothetical protein